MQRLFIKVASKIIHTPITSIGVKHYITNSQMNNIKSDALPSHGGETPNEGLTKSSCGIETW